MNILLKAKIEIIKIAEKDRKGKRFEKQSQVKIKEGGELYLSAQHWSQGKNKLK